MNPYKKIEKLNKKIETLQADKDNLMYQFKEAERIKRECELRTKLAEEKELEYGRLITELKKEKLEYTSLNSELQLVIKNVKSTYKKSFNDIKQELVN